MSSHLPENVFEEVSIILDSIKDSPPSDAYSSLENQNNIEAEKHFTYSKCNGCFGGKKIEVTIQEENIDIDNERNTHQIKKHCDDNNT